MNYSLDEIRSALELPNFDGPRAQKKMIPRPRGERLPDMPGKPRLGGVLLLLYPKGDSTYLVLTRRRDDLGSHAGQISFPGGQRGDGESIQETALREAQEDIGVDPAELTLLGHLTTL